MARADANQINPHNCRTTRLVHNTPPEDVVHIQQDRSTTTVADTYRYPTEPASADADNNDHTITKCIGFAKRWGAGGIRVVNLYAWRATYPGDLQLVEDPVGPDNDQALTEALTDAARNRLLVVAAWGGGHADPARARAVADLADDCGVQLRAFGTTLAGAPRHPVRLSYASELTPWSAS